MSKKIYRVLVVAMLLLSNSYLKAATFTAKASSNWNNYLTTWGTLTGPTASDIVIIPTGFTVTVNINNAVASTLTINGTGKLTISANDKLTLGGALTNAGTITMNTGTTLSVGGALTNSGTITTSTGSLLIGGSLTNSGTFTLTAGGTLTFNGAANSTIAAVAGGTYSITGTVVLNMGSSTTLLDVQDPDFITGINTGAKYYFTFTKGTFKMDNSGTLNNAYNSGSNSALTIPYGVVLESDNGTMNLASKGSTGSVILSGELYMNGGTVNVQTGQATNAGADFQYKVNGGRPQLYITSGTLNVGAGFNPVANTDYIDFQMTGGTMLLSANGHSNAPTFRLQDVTGGKTMMSGGLIDIRNATTGNGDLDMGGSNVASTLYSVTGGTVQLGDNSTQNDGDFWGLQAYSTTNYPNIDVEPGTAKTAGINNSGSINMMSLKLNTNATFDATQFTYINITANNTTYALDDEGSLLSGTVEFSGGVSQVITSTANSNISIANLEIANTSGNVILDLPVTVTNQLSFTSGLLDASSYPLTISNGGAVLGAGSGSYVITGNGVSPETGYLAIQKLTKNATTTFPIGTTSNYLPLTIAPGNNTNTAYSAYVYPGVTTNAQSSGTSVSSAVLSTMADVTWNVTRTAGTTNATLGLNWASGGTALEGSAFQTYGTRIGITQYTGGAWQSAAGTGNVATETASSSFGSFTEFSVIGTPIALPIVLANFTAQPKGKTAYLSWAAYPDGQAASFTIERSVDNVSWSSIGLVQADASAIALTSYSFTDVAPVIGQDNYRLFIQNEDGSTTYSPIRAVEFTSLTQLSLYPNPANAAITISVGSISGGTGSGKSLVFRLVNSAGQVLQSRVVDAGVASSITMNTSSYPAGVYYVETFEDGQLYETTAVMVAH